MGNSEGWAVGTISAPLDLQLVYKMRAGQSGPMWALICSEGRGSELTQGPMLLQIETVRAELSSLHNTIKELPGDMEENPALSIGIECRTSSWGSYRHTILLSSMKLERITFESVCLGFASNK